MVRKKHSCRMHVMSVFVRSWAIPGTKGIEHRVGGLEKEDLTGNVSYDPDNHEKMVRLRKKKVEMK
jgi:2-oxoglutarate/2-oxoacid ferredoxin oxidoreductase subunit alpha